MIGSEGTSATIHIVRQGRCEINDLRPGDSLPKCVRHLCGASPCRRAEEVAELGGLYR